MPARRPPHDAERRYEFVAPGEDTVLGDLAKAVFSIPFQTIANAIGDCPPAWRVFSVTTSVEIRVV